MACGGGALSAWLADHTTAAVVGVDLSAGQLAHARRWLAAGAGPPCGSSSTTSCTSTSLPSRPSRHPPTRRSAWTPPATCPTGGRRCARSRPGCGQEVVQQAPGACSTAPASWSPGRPITLGVAGGTCPVLGVGWPPWTGCLGRMIMAAR
ncbi:MAG TPA: class I SAM-dependent methyltransferase [Actinomycetes bacterium]|nr:class I SAM-dependent methyltransferase [Actinomycetes bacterium]